MHGARPGRHQQGPTLVLVQHAVRRARGHVADCVCRETGNFGQFARLRQDLKEQRVVRIAAAHARDEPARHTQREASVGPG